MYKLYLFIYKIFHSPTYLLCSAVSDMTCSTLLAIKGEQLTTSVLNLISSELTQYQNSCTLFVNLILVFSQLTLGSSGEQEYDNYMIYLFNNFLTHLIAYLEAEFNGETWLIDNVHLNVEDVDVTGETDSLNYSTKTNTCLTAK